MFEKIPEAIQRYFSEEEKTKRKKRRVNNILSNQRLERIEEVVNFSWQQWRSGNKLADYQDDGYFYDRNAEINYSQFPESQRLSKRNLAIVALATIGFAVVRKAISRTNRI